MNDFHIHSGQKWFTPSHLQKYITTNNFSRWNNPIFLYEMFLKILINQTTFFCRTFLGSGTQSSSSLGVAWARRAAIDTLYGSNSSLIIVRLFGRDSCCRRRVAHALSVASSMSHWTGFSPLYKAWYLLCSASDSRRSVGFVFLAVSLTGKIWPHSFSSLPKRSCLTFGLESSSNLLVEEACDAPGATCVNSHHVLQLQNFDYQKFNFAYQITVVKLDNYVTTHSEVINYVIFHWAILYAGKAVLF